MADNLEARVDHRGIACMLSPLLAKAGFRERANGEDEILLRYLARYERVSQTSVECFDVSSETCEYIRLPKERWQTLRQGGRNGVLRGLVLAGMGCYALAPFLLAYDHFAARARETMPASVTALGIGTVLLTAGILSQISAEYRQRKQLRRSGYVSTGNQARRDALGDTGY